MRGRGAFSDVSWFRAANARGGHHLRAEPRLITPFHVPPMHVSSVRPPPLRYINGHSWASSSAACASTVSCIVLIALFVICPFSKLSYSRDIVGLRAPPDGCSPFVRLAHARRWDWAGSACPRDGTEGRGEGQEEGHLHCGRIHPHWPLPFSLGWTPWRRCAVGGDEASDTSPPAPAPPPPLPALQPPPPLQPTQTHAQARM